MTYCTGMPTDTVCAGGEAARVKSVTMTVYGTAVGREKLLPLLETLIETEFTPMGQDIAARRAGPVAVPTPQVPVHWTAVRGQLLGSVPAAAMTTAAPVEPVAEMVWVVPAVAVGKVFVTAESALTRPLPSTLAGADSTTPGSAMAVPNNVFLRFSRAVEAKAGLVAPASKQGADCRVSAAMAAT